MPSVPTPNNPVHQVAATIAGHGNRITALERQQQQVITNAQGQTVIAFGLQPGSNPPFYGFTFYNPATGAPVAFIGEFSTGYMAFAVEPSGGTGSPVFYAGTMPFQDGSGRIQNGVEMYRDDGSAALILADLGTVNGHPHQQALQWYDRSGNTVVADDTKGGVGLANPHIPLGFLANTNSSTWPQTTATSMTTIAECFVEQQNPGLAWQIYGVTNTGTGQMQLQLNGTTIGISPSFGTGGTTWSGSYHYPAGWSYGAVSALTLQAYGSGGTVYAQQLLLNGIQS